MSLEFLRHEVTNLLAVQISMIHDPDSSEDIYREYNFLAEIVVCGGIRAKYFKSKNEAIAWVNETTPKLLDQWAKSMWEYTNED